MLGYNSRRYREEAAAQNGVQTFFRLSERLFCFDNKEDKK